ncbi:MFS general substrate transporter [Polychaeton citri CBS 116435]|uniref:MFS general substrate transporter n=1 Tax=Polychaeton citri CBS 116435 TaxID=1314669 RepID=A0A9P4QFY3_9PEZI|nr:MFS general substrate transporter [Polychaeton citri CBS 116435]
MTKNTARTSTSQPSAPTSSGVDHCKETSTTDSSGGNIASQKGEARLHGIGLALVIIAVYLSVFCVALDNTIIATAIPTITDQFHSIEDVGWYGSAYLLCEAAFQLFFGKLYTVFDLKYIYLSAIVLFEIGSAVCASAPKSAAFILGRAIAGVGSAGIFSGATLVIARGIPLSQRPIYIGTFGAMYGLASAAGPLIGGALTTHVTWRWCFYINLPAGAVTVAFMMLIYKSKDTGQVDGHTQQWKEKLVGLDYLGTAFFLPAIISLLLALQWGGTTYAWSSWRIILTLTFFGVLMTAFSLTQWQKQDMGTVPPRILKRRSVSAAALFGFCIVGSMFSMVYYLPIWFQAIEGVDAMQSGIRSIALVLSLVVASMAAGVAVATVVGYYNPFMIASSVLASVGAGMLCLLKVDSKAGVWIGYQILYGIGIGFGMQQSLMVVQTVLPDNEVPIGTAIINFSQTLGGALSVSVASNLFDNRLVSELSKAVPDLDPSRLVIAGATKIRDLVPAESLPDVLQAYNAALVQTFRVPMALAALSVLGALAVEWRSVRQDETSLLSEES